MNKDLRRSLLGLSMVVALSVVATSCEKDEFEQLDQELATTQAELDALQAAVKKLTSDQEALLVTLNDALAKQKLELEAAIAAGDDVLRDELASNVSALELAIQEVELTPGPQGVQGIQGLQGIQGIPGINGINGNNGADGEDGEDGADGVGEGGGLTESQIQALIDAAIADIPAADLSGLQSQIDAIDIAIAALPAEFDDSALQASITDLQGQIDALVIQSASQIQELIDISIAQIAADDDSGLQSQIDDINILIAALPDEFDDSDLQDQIDDLQDQINVLNGEDPADEYYVVSATPVTTGGEVTTEDFGDPITSFLYNNTSYATLALAQAAVPAGTTVSIEEKSTQARVTKTADSITTTTTVYDIKVNGDDDGLPAKPNSTETDTVKTPDVAADPVVTPVKTHSYTAPAVNGTDSISFAGWSAWSPDNDADTSVATITQTRTNAVVYTAVDANDGLTITGTDGVEYAEGEVETQTQQIANPLYEEPNAVTDVEVSVKVVTGGFFASLQSVTLDGNAVTDGAAITITPGETLSFTIDTGVTVVVKTLDVPSDATADYAIVVNAVSGLVSGS